MPQNRPKSEKRLLNVYTISHSRRIFAHIQMGGAGWQWGEGGKPLNRTKVRSRQKYGFYSVIVGLTDLGIFFA
jgi:hypothetical protein